VNNNKVETEKAVGAFFNVAGLVDFVSTRDQSISKMSVY
jgi:hypothetical protein